jgi:hypothetical protein
MKEIVLSNSPFGIIAPGPFQTFLELSDRFISYFRGYVDGSGTTKGVLGPWLRDPNLSRILLAFDTSPLP